MAPTFLIYPSFFCLAGISFLFTLAITPSPVTDSFHQRSSPLLCPRHARSKRRTFSITVDLFTLPVLLYMYAKCITNHTRLYPTRSFPSFPPKPLANVSRSDSYRRLCALLTLGATFSRAPWKSSTSTITPATSFSAAAAAAAGPPPTSSISSSAPNARGRLPRAPAPPNQHRCTPHRDPRAPSAQRRPPPPAGTAARDA